MSDSSNITVFTDVIKSIYMHLKEVIVTSCLLCTINKIISISREINVGTIYGNQVISEPGLLTKLIMFFSASLRTEKK